MLTLTVNGYGKRSSSYEYRVTNRGGKGIIAIGDQRPQRQARLLLPRREPRPGDADHPTAARPSACRSTSPHRRAASDPRASSSSTRRRTSIVVSVGAHRTAGPRARSSRARGATARPGARRRPESGHERRRPRGPDRPQKRRRTRRRNAPRGLPARGAFRCRGGAGPSVVPGPPRCLPHPTRRPYVSRGRRPGTSTQRSATARIGRDESASSVHPKPVTIAPEAKTHSVAASATSVSFVPCTTARSCGEMALARRLVAPMKPKFQPIPRTTSAT